MAITQVKERHDTLNGTDSIDRTTLSATRKYWARSDIPNEDLLDVNAAVLAVAPLTYAGLTRSKITSDHQGGGLWYSSVEYTPYTWSQLGDYSNPASLPTPPTEPGANTPLGPNANGGPSYSFSTGGGNTHITRSLQTISMTGLAGIAVPDHKRAIGVTVDTVEGTDIASPKLELTISKRFTAISIAYIRQLAKATGCTNNANWYNCDRGEVLFLGADGRYTGNGNDAGWEITYRFQINPNEVNIEIVPDGGVPGAGLIVPAKRGHEYLWVGYTEDVSNGRRILKPTYAYVEQVYTEINFKSMIGF